MDAMAGIWRRSPMATCGLINIPPGTMKSLAVNVFCGMGMGPA
jgi:hypothetical protein